MRMNRGTIFLIAALLVVIVAVLLVNNNQASAPTATPTVAEATGPLFGNLIAGNIVRYEVRDNVAGTFTSVSKDSGGAWHIDGTNTLAGRDPDQTTITTTAGQIASIAYNNTFTDDKLETFGLNAPAYSVLVTTSDGTLYTVLVGSKAPTSARYYAVVQQSTTALATAEASSSSGAAVATENISGQNSNETGVQLAPTLIATAEATAEATAATTPEATAAPASKRIRQQATEEPTAEVTSEATQQAAVATENIDGQNANESGVLPASTATVEATSAATAEATSEATAEVTAIPTANTILNPGVTLSGQQTIYVIPQTVVDTLKKWLTAPPYAPLPTDVPTVEAVAPTTTAAPTIEVTPEATAAITAEATSATTPEATAAVPATAEATAEATSAQ